MALRKFIELDADGYITGTVEADVTGDPTPGLIEVGSDVSAVLGQHYDPGTSTLGARRPIRHVRSSAFRLRWTEDEEIALEQAADAKTQAGRTLRVILRRLYASPSIDLDSAELVDVLQRLSVSLISSGIWADQAAADLRLAALRADGTEDDQ